MSQPAFKALDLPFELVVDDGIPMDNFLHPIRIGLFRDLVAEVERQRAEAECQPAEAECQRANAAEAELARLRALLDERS